MVMKFDPYGRLMINRGNRILMDVTKTGNGERGAAGKRGTEVWERVVSGNLHKNPKWRSKKRERERRRQSKEFEPWLKSGGDEIANQTHIGIGNIVIVRNKRGIY